LRILLDLLEGSGALVDLPVRCRRRSDGRHASREEQNEQASLQGAFGESFGHRTGTHRRAGAGGVSRDVASTASTGVG
jgi:hypothetical protein